ncbi:uncharacterized protein G2W53_018747 [Senna tora]|uniref:Uncharacterized protein n=1 Tax=Senna tora TaxID=362788 RepID=A0A834WNM1_9FABA|nr:uncharacterized protein G2W53_018747 [Senna tora]
MNRDERIQASVYRGMMWMEPV